MAQRVLVTARMVQSATQLLVVHILHLYMLKRLAFDFFERLCQTSLEVMSHVSKAELHVKPGSEPWCRPVAASGLLACLIVFEDEQKTCSRYVSSCG
jgi:hypothetical protein